MRSPGPGPGSLDRADTPLRSNNTVQHVSFDEAESDAADEPSRLRRQQNNPEDTVKPTHSDEFLGVDLYPRKRKTPSSTAASNSRGAPPSGRTQPAPPPISVPYSHLSSGNITETPSHRRLPEYDEPSWCDFLWCCDRSQANVVVLGEVPPTPSTGMPDASSTGPTRSWSKDASLAAPAPPIPLPQSAEARRVSGISSVLTIQRYYRGYYIRCRSELPVLRLVRTLQKLQKQRRERRQSERPKLRESRLNRAERYYAAVVIQGHWRHYKSWKDRRTKPSSPKASFSSTTSLSPASLLHDMGPSGETNMAVDDILDKLSPRLQDPVRRVLEKQNLKHRIYSSQQPRRRSTDDRPAINPPLYEIRRSLSADDLASLSDSFGASWGGLTFSTQSRSVGTTYKQTRDDEVEEKAEKAEGAEKGGEAGEKAEGGEDEGLAERASDDSDDPPSPGSSHPYALPASLATSPLEKFLDQTQKDRHHISSESQYSSVDSVAGHESKYTGETITSIPEGDDFAVYMDTTMRAGTSRVRVSSSSNTEPSLGDQCAEVASSASVSRGYEPDASQSSFTPVGLLESSSRIDTSPNQVQEDENLRDNSNSLQKSFSEEAAHIVPPPGEQARSAGEEEEESLAGSRLLDDSERAGTYDSELSAEDYGYGDYHESVPSLAYAMDRMLTEELTNISNSPDPNVTGPSRSQSMPTSKQWPDSLFGKPEFGTAAAEEVESSVEERRRSIAEDPFDKSFVVATPMSRQVSPRAASEGKAATALAKVSDGEHATSQSKTQLYRQKMSRLSPKRHQQRVTPVSTPPVDGKRQDGTAATSSSKQPDTAPSQMDDILEFGPLHAAQTKRKVKDILQNMRNRMTPSKSPSRQTVVPPSTPSSEKHDLQRSDRVRDDATEFREKASAQNSPTITQHGQTSEIKVSVHKFLSKVPKTPSPSRTSAKKRKGSVSGKQDSGASVIVDESAQPPRKTRGSGDAESLGRKDRPSSKTAPRSKSPLRVLRNEKTLRYVGQTEARYYVREYLRANGSAVFSPLKSDETPSVLSLTPDPHGTPSTPRSWPTVYTQYVHRTRHVHLKMSTLSSQASQTLSPLPATRLFPSTPNLQKAQRRSSAEALRRSPLEGSLSSPGRIRRLAHEPRMRRPPHLPNQPRRQSGISKAEIGMRSKTDEPFSTKSVEKDKHRVEHALQLTPAGGKTPVVESKFMAAAQSEPAANIGRDLESVPATARMDEKNASASRQVNQETDAPLPLRRNAHQKTFVVVLSAVGLGIFLYRTQQQQQQQQQHHQHHPSVQMSPGPHPLKRESETLYGSLPPPLPSLRED